MQLCQRFLKNVIKNKFEVTWDSLGWPAHIVLDPESKDKHSNVIGLLDNLIENLKWFKWDSLTFVLSANSEKTLCQDIRAAPRKRYNKCSIPNPWPSGVARRALSAWAMFLQSSSLLAMPLKISLVYCKGTGFRSKWGDSTNFFSWLTSTSVTVSTDSAAGSSPSARGLCASTSLFTVALISCKTA